MSAAASSVGHLSPAVFPSLRARNLNRRTFHLPGDFEGQRNVVIVAFEREHQALVDSWSTVIQELLVCHRDLHSYELPTISRGHPLFRAWLNGAMRAGIPDRQVREHTITLYVDKGAFRAALGLPHERTIYLLLLHRDGRVVWRGGGPVTPAVADQLKAALAAGQGASAGVRPSQGPPAVGPSLSAGPS